jgi:signal transduction histidine kinase
VSELAHHVENLDLRAALDAAVRDMLQPVSAGLGVLLLFLAASHALVLPRTIAPLMVGLATGSAAALLGLSIALRRWPVPARWAHPIGAAVAGLCLLNGLVHMHLVAEPRQTTNLLLLVVGAGFLFLSWRWLAAVISATWAGWGIVALTSLPSREWQHFGFALLIATVLSILVHMVRVRTVTRLESLRLHQETQRARLETSLASTQAALHLAETLNRAGRALTGTLDLADVLGRVLDHLSSIVPFDRGSVMLVHGSEIEMVAAWGFPENSRPLQIRISLVGEDNDLFRHIYLTQQPLSVPDVSERPDWQYVPGLPPARSWLGVPLIRLDKVIGMLSLTRETLSPYDEGEVTLALAFAGQAALALENARLYERILRDYEDLARLEKTKSDFIGIASHELRTPLTTLRGYSQILLGDPVIGANPLHHEVVSGLHSGVMRLQEIVSSMLDMAKVDSRALQLHPTPLAMPALIQSVCSDLARSVKERRHTLTLEKMNGLPELEVDLDAVRKVFYHLIANAIKYTPDGGTITVSGRALKDSEYGLAEGGIEIVVSDTGIGIDPRYQEMIFEKFSQTGELALHSTGQSKFKGGGPGLGLAIARGIVQAHGGKLWVTSMGHDEEACPGSQFHVVLPLRQVTRLADA